ncbi:MAG: hypothetical protein RL166_380 [Actinomycetota bacterium]|jgi:hypothetical protein
MATDYDAPRKNDDDAESLEALKDRLPEKSSVSSDLDEVEHVGEIIDPDKQDELTEVVVIPPQTDEFTCMDCFIVKHRSQMSKVKKKSGIEGPFCTECAD